MKVSLAWIFDHIDADWRQCDIRKLVALFNQVTAEFEHFQRLTLSFDTFCVARVTSKTDQVVMLESVEWACTCELAVRPDAVVGAWFVIQKKDKQYVWATMRDFGASKDGLMPAVMVPDQWHKGEWKNQIESDDCVLELNNSSITHRPDLWGMRGLARECAALLQVPLKSLSVLIEQQKVVSDTTTCTHGTLTVSNNAVEACNRLAGWSIPGVTCQPSSLAMAARLCRIDQRPINVFVDTTNYVMFDLGQPLHVFDVEKLAQMRLEARMAKNGQKLTLLDGSTIELTDKDLVISDGAQPLSLAGVMGGVLSAVSDKTKHVLLESASFNPAVVRGDATRHKLRTEASARFEKSLDPNQNIEAIGRFAFLLREQGVTADWSLPVVSVGQWYQPVAVMLAHADLERKLGVTIEPAFVHACLSALDFSVTEKDGVYTVTPPSYRGPKSITIAEDVIEEIVRFFGLANIAPQLPQWFMKPHDQRHTYHTRAIKRHMAYGLSMHEVINYPFFDEAFIASLGYEPQHTVKAKNPLSSNMVQLVNSLVPHLCKNVQQNVHRVDRVSFFECDRVWHADKKLLVREQRVMAALWWGVAQKLDFYEIKAQLQTLFDLLGMPVTWHKIGHDMPDRPWYSRYQTAVLMHHDEVVGYAGMVDDAFAQKIGNGSGFVCELDLQAMISYRSPVVVYKPASKFPSVFYDVSMLVPLSCTVAQLTTIIKSIDSRIYDVTERDLFEKAEWHDRRSVTMRFYVRDMNKTMSKEEADEVYQAVVVALAEIGAQIR